MKKEQNQNNIQKLQVNQHGGQWCSNLGITSIPEKTFNHLKHHKTKNYSLNERSKSVH